MKQEDFKTIYETSDTGKQMITDLLDIIRVQDHDREYLRHMIHHIIKNERCDAAVKAKELML